MKIKKPLIWSMLTILTLVVCLIATIAVQTRNARNKYALFNAARDGDLERVKQLIEQGSSLNLQVASSFGWTPLIGAIYQDKTNVVYYLVEAGADVNLPDKYGQTPLMWQIAHGDEEAPLVQFLIAHGAKVEAKDKDGATALSRAESDPPKTKLIEILNVAMSRSKQTD